MSHDPHVSRSIFGRAASQSHNLRWKPPVSSIHGNRRCRSWSSPIVEVVQVTSSTNKKGPSPPILVQLHIRRPPTLLAAPPATRAPRCSLPRLRPAAGIPFPASLSPSPRVPLRARGLDHRGPSPRRARAPRRRRRWQCRAFWPEPLEKTTKGAHILTAANSLISIKEFQFLHLSNILDQVPRGHVGVC